MSVLHTHPGGVSQISPRPAHIPGRRTLPEVSLFGVTALIVTVLDGALAMVPEPREDLALPPSGKFVFVLDPPCGVTDVFQGRLILPVGVILFVEDRVAVHLLHKVVVGLERFGDLTVSVDPDRKAIDMSDRPVVMGLHHHIRVVALGEGLHRLGDGVGVALVKQTAVPVVRVDDRPVVGVGDLALSEPTEALKPLPVASQLLCGIFQGHLSNHAHGYLRCEGCVVSHPSRWCQVMRRRGRSLRSQKRR